MAESTEELKKKIEALQGALTECRKLNQAKNGIAKNVQTILRESRNMLKKSGSWPVTFEVVYQNFNDSFEKENLWNALDHLP